MWNMKDILRIVPAIQSASLLNENAKLLKKKKLKTEDFMGAGVKTIIGAEFIKAESDIIEGM